MCRVHDTDRSNICRNLQHDLYLVLDGELPIGLGGTLTHFMLDPKGNYYIAFVSLKTR